MRVDQLLAAAHQGDATGDAALALASSIEAAGHQAGVYALSIDTDMEEHVRPVGEIPDDDEADTTILHFNVPSSLDAVLGSRRGRRWLVYHNLTPPDLLLPHCPDIARLTAIGRQQLEQLAASGVVDHAVGVSQYNTDDLVRTGFASTATLPLPMDLERLRGATNPVLEAELAANPMPTFLTVGRVAPNKRIDDFIKIAAYYLRYVSPEARFLIVGGTRGLEAYLDALIELHGDLELDQRVKFVHHVSLCDLITYYRAASAYVCTSKHEGFCAPLLEAMTLRVPIVARHAAAIPETLGGAGVLVDSDDPAEWAEMLHIVATDPALGSTLTGLGDVRIADFHTEGILERWVTALTEEAQR